jgi:FHA domain-containing protein
VRFEITNVLDEIERQLSTDLVITQVVLDLGEVARFAALDGGRPVNLLRLGLVLDALAHHLAESSVLVYPVAGRDLMADQDLTSKERMVLGRWADDGLIEVVGMVGDRVAEVADLTGLPLVSRDGLGQYVDRYPWLRHQPDRVLRLTPRAGAAGLAAPPPQRRAPGGPGAAVTTRLWRCPRRECPAFGDRRRVDQPAPRLRAGVPVCPRHDEPLTDLGPRPPAIALALVVDGVVRHRFAVRAGRPTLIGRAPEDPDGVHIGPWLVGEGIRWVSRTHARLDLLDEQITVTDLSTNGTVVKRRTAPNAPAEVIELSTGQRYPLGRFDTIELYDGVEVGRPGHGPGRRPTSSVMADAPTIALRGPIRRPG